MRRRLKPGGEKNVSGQLKKNRWNDSEEEKASVKKNERMEENRCFTPEEIPSLPGSIFMLSNQAIQISNDNSTRHPALVRAVAQDRNLMCFHGTSAATLAERYAGLYVFTVEPDAGNGLSRATAFSRKVKRVPYRRLFKSCKIGVLSEDDWRLARQCLPLPNGVAIHE